MKHRKLVALAMISIFAFLVVGCGPAAQKDGGGSSTETPSPGPGSYTLLSGYSANGDMGLETITINDTGMALQDRYSWHFYTNCASSIDSTTLACVQPELGELYVTTLQGIPGEVLNPAGDDGQRKYKALYVTWTRDGKWIVAAAIMPGKTDSDILLIDPKTANFLQLTDKTVDEVSPTTYIAGNKINVLFARSHNPSLQKGEQYFDIYQDSFDVSSSVLPGFTKESFVGSLPLFPDYLDIREFGILSASPDGKTLLVTFFNYQNVQDTDAGVYLFDMQSPGTLGEIAKPFSLSAASPAWSADGSLIAFVECDWEGQQDVLALSQTLFVMDLETSLSRELVGFDSISPVVFLGMPR
jgi:hypothetical protein